MNNLCITNYAMIFMFIIIILLVINQKKISKNKENFVLGNTDLTNLRTEINRNYDMDVDAIRNLGQISKSLLTGTNNIIPSVVGTPGTLTIPANNTILRGITFDNSTWHKTYNSNGKTHSVGYIVSDNNVFKKLMIVGNNTGGVRSVGIWDELNVNGNMVVTSNLQINGNVTVKGTIQDKYYPIGVNQIYNRVSNTFYYQNLSRVNKSGRPIQVCISFRTLNRAIAVFHINGRVISRRSQRSDIGCDSFNIIVPNGAPYGITEVKDDYFPYRYSRLRPNVIIISWYELSIASYSYEEDYTYDYTL